MANFANFSNDFYLVLVFVGAGIIFLGFARGLWNMVLGVKKFLKDFKIYD